ncbi:MAG: TIGR00266 family protein [Oscillospiraceae bacterium]|nr:TIGR00266 family protein [Oscillospiraceae bacterium]
MQYQIQGKPYPVATITLDANESILCQRGAMSWMTPNIAMQTKGGGIGKMFSRAFSGESMFQNIYTAQNGPGLIAFAASVPGEIMAVDMTPGMEIVAQKSAFLASSQSVNFELFFQKKFSAGFFGGEGFIMQKFSGSGTLLLEIDGSLISYDLAPGQSMLIDTGHLAAMDATCSIDIESVKGVGNALLGGEGLFNTKVTGPGRIWLQTMPLCNLAGSIARYIPRSS